MKNKRLFFCRIICSLTVLALQPCITVGAKFAPTANYGTKNDIVIGPDCFANIKVFDPDDPDNSIINNLSFELYDPEGNLAATWKGNRIDTFNRKNFSVNLVYENDYLKFFYDSLSYPDNGNITMKELRAVYTDPESGELTNRLSNTDFYLPLNFNNVYDITAGFFRDKPSDITLPAYTVGVYSDAGWNNRLINWSFDLGIFQNEEFFKFKRVKSFVFKNNPGNLVTESMDAGEYGYILAHDKNDMTYSSTNLYSSIIKLNDTSSEYVRETINLHEKFPKVFNENGTYTYTVYYPDSQKNYYIDHATDSLDPLVSGALCVLSGNMITAPVPDQNGNISIYVDSKTRKFKLISDYMAENTFGGGSTGLEGTADEKINAKVKTIPFDSNGINLQGNPGTYKVKVTNLPFNYQMTSGNEFTLTHYEKTDENAKCIQNDIRIEKIKRKLTLTESKHGKVTINGTDKTEDTISCNTDVSLSAVSDKYYELEKYICRTDNDLEITNFSIPKTGSFTMPSENITVEPVFVLSSDLDINGDGSVSILDAVILKKMLLLFDNTEQYKEKADITGDGYININDLIRLENLIME